ncbi:D-sedoheptulose 7-phosphate isomerase [Desulfurispora thermophila]|uniref:D-sedoheptulose 7-phosphate isomerase n=1 Tax=Desulfurispora thermophila TaxID=265470 RepID=UPI0003726993|nr:D-sedoheptulose 7-phosphate isomerase [Desulfurispora thermophila]
MVSGVNISFFARAVVDIIDEHKALIDVVHDMAPSIEQFAKLMAKTLASGCKILLCGNGGSAADAQHIAGELVGRFLKERSPLPALALSVNSSVLTAIGNDYDFREVFARQVAALGCPGDLLVAISTSGNSPNVLRASEVAREKGMKIVGLTGGEGGKLKGLCDLCINIPSKSTPRIQEIHILIGHIVCQLVEEALC